MNELQRPLRQGARVSTVEKALSVLELFSESRPKLRVAEIARHLAWDKSTVQRYIAGLAARGLLEQDMHDKSYKLGAALTRLAMLRERTNPVVEGVTTILGELVDSVGETAHASEFVAGSLTTIAIVETRIRGTRVYIDASEPLPLHASGSGIAYLSAVSQSRAKALLSGKLHRHTPSTEVRKSRVTAAINRASVNGYAKCVGTFESDVVGIAAPVLGFNDEPIGAVAVATPMARVNAALEKKIIREIIPSASRLSRLYGASGIVG